MNTIKTDEENKRMIDKETSASIIKIENLNKKFGAQEVLKNVSLELNNGENLVVLGKSGSGKSVLIKCIVRLLDISSGTITVMGENVSSLPYEKLNAMRKKIGFLFQSCALYDSMTVRQNLEFGLKRGDKIILKNEMDNKVKEALDHVGLSDTIEKMPSQLSGGMRKRISLARTIIMDPVIMLYDEPTTGLDPVTAGEISGLINEIQKKYKTSSIIITHDIACARATADRILMLHNGEIYQEGTMALFENSHDEIISQFFNNQELKK